LDDNRDVDFIQILLTDIGHPKDQRSNIVTQIVGQIDQSCENGNGGCLKVIRTDLTTDRHQWQEIQFKYQHVYSLEENAKYFHV
jgi:hypothetical protein